MGGNRRAVHRIAAASTIKTAQSANRGETRGTLPLVRMATVAERGRVKERRRDHRRRIAVDVALALAEMNASWGDHSRALEHLAAADQLAAGALAHRLVDLRESWVEQAAGGA